MDDRTRRRSRHDEAPVIGDYSDDEKTRLRPHVPDDATQPHAVRVAPRARDDEWKLDPRDVKRHALRASQRRSRGWFVKLRRYAAIALAVVVGFLVYWKFDALRGIASGFGSPVGGDVAASGDDAPRIDAEPAIAGTDIPVAAADEPTVIEAPPAPVEVPVREEIPVARESPPPVPPEPETLAFSRPVNTVSEADAAAPVIVLRRGGTRGASAFTWWTSDGTARAGADYADLGMVVETFAVGQQTRTIRVPIVGDRAVEQPETFYVHLAPGGRADASHEVRTEVVIDSDD